MNAAAAVAEVDYLNLEPGTQLGKATYIGNLEDGSEAWHAQRALVIGGSEVAPIVGIKGFRSKYTLWLEKAGLYKPAPPSEESQELFDWGHALEPVIAEQFHKMFPHLYPARTGSWVSTENEWHGANTDYLLLNEVGGVVGILECKYSTRGSGWENYQAPHKYVVQLRYYLQCIGLDEGYLACFSAGQLLVFRVNVLSSVPVVNMRTGEQEWYSMGGPDMIPLVREFVESLPRGDNPGTPPELDAHDENVEYLKDKHPDIVNEDVQVPEELAQEYGEARIGFDEAEERLEKAKLQLMDLLGNAKGAKVGKKSIAGRRAKGKGKPYLQAVGKPFLPLTPDSPIEASEDTAAPAA